MKQKISLIVLLLMMAIISCACDHASVNEKKQDERSYTSLYMEVYAGAQRNELTAIYELLYSKSESLPLASDIELDLQNIDSMTGTISFRLADKSDKDLWDAKLDETKRYLSIIATVYGMQDGGVTVYYGGSSMDENFTLSQLMDELPGNRATYEQNEEGILQLVNDLNLGLTLDDATKIWQMRQSIQGQYQKTLQLLDGEDALYDVPMFSCFFDENAETNRYQVLAYVLKDKGLGTDKKTDKEYEKAAEILMNQYTQIEQITFRILTEKEQGNYQTENELVFRSADIGQKQNEVLMKQDENESLQTVQIEGSFAAMVREKVPNYVLDDTTPNTLLVTMFQDSPFVIHTSAMGDLVDKVEVGKVYIFEIEPKVIGEFKESELDYTYLSPHIALNLYHLQIANIYEVDDEETYSLHGGQLRYVVGE